MYLLPLILAVSSYSASSLLDFPVCIVGAGPAGLAAAKRLEAKGQKIVVFEKQPKVGGKCQAVYDT
jgi:flavin-dependent dehydrogenase